ncbi:hypothetical protein SAMN05877838_2671 [Hoeflea halophila]|uniref:Uncharacterized protein n=1 Tax=Hoeflea halophila TaxID=714899 RepID=A0A286ICB4_9HYPH|nr:hypothetical protein [Hoeflea halophila]SOE17768.1 hypothetical protein SAMN05877838_2671 [Hoeflea halophila]
MTTESTNCVSRFFSAARQSLNFAFQAERLAHTPDAAFKALGTTRQQALRNLADQL